MEIDVFELERIQSLYENKVDYNLTETGLHPLTLKELLTGDEVEELTTLRLGYGQTDGSPELKETISCPTICRYVDWPALSVSQ